MAYYGYKRVIYRDDYLKKQEEIEKDREPFNYELDYDGDHWIVIEGLLDDKDRDVAVLKDRLLTENETLVLETTYKDRQIMAKDRELAILNKLVADLGGCTADTIMSAHQAILRYHKSKELAEHFTDATGDTNE